MYSSKTVWKNEWKRANVQLWTPTIMATLPQPIKIDVQSKINELDSVPLFMKSLPDDPSNQGEALDALQALVYDGTPDGEQSTGTFPPPSDIRSAKPEVAANFKTQGNEYIKAKRYREAMGFYSQALDAKPTDPTLVVSLLLNRAVCNLELSKSPEISLLEDLPLIIGQKTTGLS